MFSDITALLLEKQGGFQWINECNTSINKICSSKMITDSIIEQIEYSKNIIPFKTEKLPVIFMPLSSNIFFRSLQIASNGKILQKGISPLSDKSNQKVLNEKITITDEPLLKSMNGSIPFDCEGITSRKNIIFNDGVFKNFIFDLETAARLNKKTTGNASRSYSSKPSPGFTNFIVKNGKIKISEMIKSLNKGIIIYDLIGAGQSNLLSGDYSVNIGLGFYIENGIIQGRVKNAMIAGNIYEDLLSNIEDISYDTRTFQGYTFPAILFKEKKVVA
jgi:PmbA protein